jgi:hypothetical protein
MKRIDYRCDPAEDVRSAPAQRLPGWVRSCAELLRMRNVEYRKCRQSNATKMHG